jgi:Sel1 repeat
MKQTLHWNVSGIPPEARDVARAAATKEGLTVGDWLTRRILAERRPADVEPEATPDAEPDVKPIGPRLVRLETDQDPVSRRIEESLRFLSKRIEVSERAQLEAQRTLSIAAAEIQAATRNQSEAFAQFAERIERVEKTSDTAPLREALRGLHQGVALLTDQIAKTSTESAGQVAVLASSVEAMALKIAATRDESVRLERAIDERLSAFAERLKQMEERAQSAPATQQVLETRIDAVEIRMREAFSLHVAAVERDFATIIARLDDAEQGRGQGHIQETIATLNRRFESSERRSKEALAALQLGLSDATARISRIEVPTADNPPIVQQAEAALALVRDLRPVPLAEPEDDAAEPSRTEISGASEYLAQTRRAAQAADPTPASAWHVPSATRRTRETSRLARLVTQGFFLLLVMCTGFLLMQYLGPQLIPSSLRAGAVAAPVSADVRALALKANQGGAGAELLLGLKYAEGDGIAKNDAEAAKWLQRAAEKGQALAQYRLGTLYEKGLGVPLDTKVAADWYAKAAEAGNVKAMHNLAVAYANGAGRETNYTEAARWFRSAAERGMADSQFNLAVLHERGLGVQTSLTDAYRWYAIAAAEGDAESSTRVEALTSQIPAAERDAADKAADGFKAAAADAGANEAPALPDVLN